ncbi:MAG: 50S ribosomal protein L33 [bacterium]
MGDTIVKTLACQVCKERNYSFRVGAKKGKDKVEVKKFCASCRKHTNHREVK